MNTKIEKGNLNNAIGTQKIQNNDKHRKSPIIYFSERVFSTPEVSL